MQNKNFIDIKNYSKDSLQYGFQSLDEIINAAIERSSEGMGDHVFITDHNTLFSAPEFISKARKNKLIPVIGLTVHVLNSLSKDIAGTLTFYAKNDRGFESLVSIISNTEKVNGQQCITLSNLKKSAPSDVKVLLGGKDSILYNFLKKTLSEDPQEKLTGANLGSSLGPYLKGVFGQENINYEVQPVDSEEQHRINNLIRKIGAKNYIPVIPSFDIRAFKKNDMPLLKNKGKFLVLKKDDQYDYQHSIADNSYRDFFNTVDMEKHFTIDEINNLKEFTHEFNDGYSLLTDEIYIPKSGKDLREISFDALEKIIIDKSDEDKKVYRDRLEHEYEIIHSLGFDDYFLIFDDIVKNVKDANFMIRGSSIGSLMTYTLGLSNTDPIEYGLLFERFLNTSRANRSEYPDIDLETDKTEEIQEYLKSKYGSDGAFLMTDRSSIGAKSSILFVKNALSDSFEDEDNKKQFNSACFELYEPIKNKKYYKAGDGSLKEEIQKYPEFLSIIGKSVYHKAVTKLAIRVEEQVTAFRKSSASYVLIPEDKRKMYSESMVSPKDKETATLKSLEISKHTVALLGLVKLDILSNKVLGKLSLLLKDRPDIKIDKDMKDANAYRVLSEGLTFGIFQLPNQSKLCVGVKPKNFEDLVSIMALMRPSVSQETKRTYLMNRRSGKKVSIHPTIDDILEPTHGAILYDEQIMMIAQKVAGYSANESDNIRALLKGDKKDKLHELKPEFIKGGMKNGVDESTMIKIFETIEQMCGKYTFSKAHSIAYAKVAYQQAYIAHYHSAEYFSTFVVNNNDKYDTKEVLKQLNKLNGFEFRFPRPNEVFDDFRSVNENNKLTGIVPLSHLVSVNTFSAIEIARAENQFQSFQDFVKRSLRVAMEAKSSYSFEIKEKKRETILNTFIKDIEGLIKIGLFDHIVKSKDDLSVIDKRQALTENFNDLINHIKEPYSYNYDPVITKSKNELQMDISNIINEEAKFLFGASPTAEWMKNNEGIYKSEDTRKNEERAMKRRERAASLAVGNTPRVGNQFFEKASRSIEDQKLRDNVSIAPKYK